MAAASTVARKLVLKYNDKGTFSFDKLTATATDEKIYDIAQILNAFQSDKAEKILKVTTQLIIV